MNLEELLGLPWTWIGPRRVSDQDGTRYEMRIAELSDFFLADESRDALLDELRPALKAYLQTYVDRNESPPIPTGKRWQFASIPDAPRAVAAEDRAQSASAYTPLVSSSAA